MPIVMTRFEEFLETKKGIQKIASPRDKPWKIGQDLFKHGWLFEDGSYSDGEHYHIGPPEDHFALALMRWQFYEHEVKRWTEQFDRHKKNAMHRSNFDPASAPSIGPSDIDRAIELRDKVRKLTKVRDELRAILENTPEKKALRERQQREAEAHAKRRKLANELAQINI